jgi:hypothetical protein
MTRIWDDGDRVPILSLPALAATLPSPPCRTARCRRFAAIPCCHRLPLRHDVLRFSLSDARSSFASPRDGLGVPSRDERGTGVFEIDFKNSGKAQVVLLQAGEGREGTPERGTPEVP